MQKRLVGSSLKLCIQQNLHLGKIGIIQNLRNWQVTAAVDKRTKIEEVNNALIISLTNLIPGFLI